MSHDSSVESGSSDSSVESGLSGTSITDVDRSSEKLKNRLFHGILVAAASFGVVMLVFLFGDIFYEAVTGQREFGIELGRFLANTGSQTPANAGFYSGSEAKAHPFTGGMKPTTENLSTLVGTAGVGYLHNIYM